jgi:hypothetical protein
MKDRPRWVGLRPRRYRLLALLSVSLQSAFFGVVIASGVVQAADPCTGQPQSMTAGTPGAQVYPGAILCSNDSLHPELGWVENQALSLQFQSDCNLVLLTGRWRPLWSSQTGGGNCTNANSCLVMQGDGNLVIYHPNGCGNQPVRWASGTGGQPLDNYCLRVGYDGNVVIYRPGNPCGSNLSYLTAPNAKVPTWTQSGNTRPIEGADSWRTWPSLVEGRTTCVPCRSTTVNFRAYEIYLRRQPGWNPAITNAVSAWSQPPIVYSFSANPNETWNYIYASFPGDTDSTYATCGSYLNSTTTGVTLFFDQGGHLNSSWTQAISIYYAYVCLNQNLLPSGGAAVQNTAAHELGHTIGLAHNPADTSSIMYPSQTSVQGPNSNDIGSTPGCPNRDATYGGYDAGVTCIYGWGD